MLLHVRSYCPYFLSFTLDYNPVSLFYIIPNRKFYVKLFKKKLLSRKNFNFMFCTIYFEKRLNGRKNKNEGKTKNKTNNKTKNKN